MHGSGSAADSGAGRGGFTDIAAADHAADRAGRGADRRAFDRRTHGPADVLRRRAGAFRQRNACIDVFLRLRVTDLCDLGVWIENGTLAGGRTSRKHGGAKENQENGSHLKRPKRANDTGG